MQKKKHYYPQEDDNGAKVADKIKNYKEQPNSIDASLAVM